ncbi:MAG: thiamine biosynthesis lipoprotein, partial [Oleispira sp.]
AKICVCFFQTFIGGSVLLASLLAGGCSQSSDSHISKISGPTMGTEYHISWVSKTRDNVAFELEKKSIKERVDKRLSDINKSMSTYDSKSELSLINHNFNPNWQEISMGLYRVLFMAKQVNVQSDRAFDITVGPLVNLWGFGPDNASDQVPELPEINRLLAKVGSDAIMLREQEGVFQLRLAAPRYLDLSAIAKGYAVDDLGILLQEQGVDSYLVEVGGEIIAKGFKPQHQHWRIAIEAPNDDGRSVQVIIPLSNMGLATSGDYRNFFEQNGKRFSHTIDGRTGYPVDHNLASVSVLHESVALADAWATALTVLGAERGLELAEIYDLAAYFIVRTSSGYQQLSSHQFEKLRLD